MRPTGRSPICVWDNRREQVLRELERQRTCSIAYLCTAYGVDVLHDLLAEGWIVLCGEGEARLRTLEEREVEHHLSIPVVEANDLEKSEEDRPLPLTIAAPVREIELPRAESPELRAQATEKYEALISLHVDIARASEEEASAVAAFQESFERMHDALGQFLPERHCLAEPGDLNGLPAEIWTVRDARRRVFGLAWFDDEGRFCFAALRADRMD
jgi:hypothetical protein